MNSTALMSILALDVSKSACGWAFGSPDATPLSGVVRFGEPHHHYGRVAAMASRWLLDMCAMHSPDIIALEAAWMGNGGHSAETAALLIKLQGLVQQIAWIKTGREAQIVASSTTALKFTGKGRYDKDERKPAIQRETLARGWLTLETMDADRADALAVFCAVASDQIPMLAHGRAPKAKAKPHFSAEAF